MSSTKCSFADCTHYAGYLGVDDDGDYSLCACHFDDSIADECIDRLDEVIATLRFFHVEREWRPLDGMYIGGTICNNCRRPWPCTTIYTIEQGRV